MENKSPRKIIGIVGQSGSGKSTFAKMLNSALGGNVSSFVTQDDYYYPRPELSEEENKTFNFDTPECIDHLLLLEHISLLKNGSNISKSAYDFNKKKSDCTIINIESKPIILLEGFFILHFSEIRQLLDFIIYLESPNETCLIRRLNRDTTERSYDQENVLYKWEHHIPIANQKYLFPYKKYADFIISNNQETTYSDLIKKSDYIRETILNIFF